MSGFRPKRNPAQVIIAIPSTAQPNGVNCARRDLLLQDEIPPPVRRNLSASVVEGGSELCKFGISLARKTPHTQYRTSVKGPSPGESEKDLVRRFCRFPPVRIICPLRRC